jgi:Doubled CXXCH motif (Paired_CXXCH_1)
MKKLFLIAAMLVIASFAFGQAGTVPYVGTAYTTPNVAVAAEDAKLGMHDINAAASGPNGVDDRNGCVSCHAPHNAKNLVASGAPTFFSYIWSVGAPAQGFTNNAPDDYGVGTIALDNTSFHTIACLSCHDGVTATDVYAKNNGFTNFGNYARKGFGGDLSHDHPVNSVLTKHGSTNPTLAYAKLYGTTHKPDPADLSGQAYGSIECGSCHDPHKGDGATYMFLRGPAGGVTPRYARIGLCRDCHSSK